MKQKIIDTNTKAFLVACLVSGVNVESDPQIFMTGLVTHINSLTGRQYWAVGDQDGVILHDRFDTPILTLLYDGQILKFMVFETHDLFEEGIQKEVGLMLLNILGYIQELGLNYMPVSSHRFSKVVSPPSTTTEDPSDWSL